MNSNQFRRTRVAAAVAGLVLAFGAGQAFGAAFILQENSGSGQGNAYAGGAAASEDADTVWTNPAGMQRLKSPQVAVAVNFITPSMKFGDNGGSLAAQSQTLGGSGGDAGSLNVVPNLFLVVPITKGWHFGLGINAPFGLVTEYDSTWLGRFQAIKSDVKTMNVNPAISYQFGDFAVGAGANYQQIKATFTQNANYSAALLQAAVTAGIKPGTPTFNAIAQSTPFLESNVNINGDDSSWGWNVGFEWKPDNTSRFGASYRSAIKYNVTGNVSFNNPALPSTIPPSLAPTVAALAAGVNSKFLYNSGVTSDIKVPPFANVSYFTQLKNTKWDLMGDVQWTGWSTIQDLTFNRTDGNPVQSTAENFKDVWRVSGGANYHYNDQWLVRMGVAWDQTPVQNQYRTARLPDSDRIWLSTGAQYKFSPAWKFDVGASYIFVKNGNIYEMGSTNLGQPPSVAQNGLIDGTYKNNVIVVSAQVTYTWDQPPQAAPKVAEVAPAPAPVAKPAPPPPPPPAPAPAPAPTPQVQKITLDSKVLFDFDKAVLKPEGKAAIDSQVVGRLAEVQKLDVVLVTGHTDRLGTDAYNQKLSERRADAVRDYLVSKGVDKAKIETIGLGEKQPVVQCDQKNRKDLIACLQPNRRVELQVKGEARK
jgi:long-chain fatty acid transport protein